MSWVILRGNAINIPLADESVHCVVTSPPYFGLRSYGTPPTDWPEIQYTAIPGLEPITVPAMQCCLGLEPTLESYIAHIVAIFREVRRVLHRKGVMWLNMGDSYSRPPSYTLVTGALSDIDYNNGDDDEEATITDAVKHKAVYTGLRPKELCMIPARIALALQADGWILRSDVIWAKGLSFCDAFSGAMTPESVMNRPTKAHEHVFLFAKNEDYFYDSEAVRERATSEWAKDFLNQRLITLKPNTGKGMRYESGLRNIRSVWVIGPSLFSSPHFAAMPTDLAEVCIKAGTSKYGCCSHCGSPWERVIDRKITINSYLENQRKGAATLDNLPLFSGAPLREEEKDTLDIPINDIRTVGWRPTCSCPPADPVPCTVFDPFVGSGTTVLVADRLGYHGVGLELNYSYCALAEKRLANDAPLLLTRVSQGTS